MYKDWVNQRNLTTILPKKNIGLHRHVWDIHVQRPCKNLNGNVIHFWENAKLSIIKDH